jgi:glycosyltransferase involved in cell wall biosynthesis
MPAIHQLVAGFSNGDAISNEARVLRARFREWGCPSDIFSEARRILPELRSEARDAAGCAAAIGERDVALLHLSIGSPVNELFRSLRCRKAILYHNVTPPSYFALVNPQISAHLARGLEQVRALAGAAEVNMADSAFNAHELEQAGYRDVRVLPLVLDLAALRSPPDRAVTRRFADGAVNVLFVGRCVPNKRIEDALRVFALFHHAVCPQSRFIHVGSFAGTERYYYYLLSLARDLGLRDTHFAGAVPQSALNAYYRCATLFLCMSEHEGFCIPLMESMLHGVPVVARAAAAVPETLGGSGVLAHDSRFETIAEMMGRLVNDQALREAVIEGQRQRLSLYERRDLGQELRTHLAPLLGESGTPGLA